MDGLALLCNLHADGPLSLRRLRQAGIRGLDQVHALPEATLANLLKASPAQARRFAQEAALLRDRMYEVSLEGTVVRDTAPGERWVAPNPSGLPGSSHQVRPATPGRPSRAPETVKKRPVLTAPSPGTRKAPETGWQPPVGGRPELQKPQKTGAWQRVAPKHAPLGTEFQPAGRRAQAEPLVASWRHKPDRTLRQSKPTIQQEPVLRRLAQRTERTAPFGSFDPAGKSTVQPPVRSAASVSRWSPKPIPPAEKRPIENRVVVPPTQPARAAVEPPRMQPLRTPELQPSPVKRRPIAAPLTEVRLSPEARRASDRQPVQSAGTTLRAGQIDGLDQKTCELLMSQGVRTYKDLVDLSSLSLARRLQIPYTRLLELQFQARRFLTARLQPERQRLTPAPKPTSSFRPAGRPSTQSYAASPAWMAAPADPTRSPVPKHTAPRTDPGVAGPFV